MSKRLDSAVKRVGKRKLPETCAVCGHSGKDELGWSCLENGEVEIHIPCRRGALPKPPKWCPRRNP